MNLMMRFLFFLVFFCKFIYSNDIYVNSSALWSSDGNSPNTPLMDLNTAFYRCYSSGGGSVWLMNSSKNYTFDGSYSIYEWVRIISYPVGNATSQLITIQSNLNIQVFNTLLQFENVNITRLGVGYIDYIFIMKGTSYFNLYSCKVFNFPMDSRLKGFLREGPCIISINNTIFNNISSDSMQVFFEIWQGSQITINNTQIISVWLNKSNFITIWDVWSYGKLQNTLIKDCDFNAQGQAGGASFLMIRNWLTVLNVTIKNISLHNGSLIEFTYNTQSQSYNVTIQNSYMIDVRSNGTCSGLKIDPGLVFHLRIENCSFVLFSAYAVGGMFTSMDPGDWATISLKNVTFDMNFGMVMYMNYIYQLSFQNVLIRNNNLRPSGEIAIANNSAIYILNTVNLIFDGLYINGSWSDVDVAGMKIHINIDIITRPNTMVKNALSSGVKLFVNFTNCIFANSVSINKNWMDKGSALTLHTDIPLNSYFINTSWIGNQNDLGATCLEAFGQTIMSFYFINCTMARNQAQSGCSCLYLKIASVIFFNSFFDSNALTNKPMTDIQDGTYGGVIYPEVPVVTFTFCVFHYNQAVQGGVFYFYSSIIQNINISIENCYFKGNRAQIGGVLSMALVLLPMNLSVRSNVFENNQALSGGVFYFDFRVPCNVSIENNTFISNQANLGGAAYFRHENNVIPFVRNLWSFNKAWNFTYFTGLSFGGVHYFSDESESQILSYCEQFLNNTSTHHGGALVINRGFAKLDSATFLGNFAADQAGSIFLKNSGSSEIHNSSFENEIAAMWAGSILVMEHAALKVFSTQFSNCMAKSGGVFFIIDHQGVNLTETILSSNQAYEGGIMTIDSSSNNVSFSMVRIFNCSVQKSLFKVSSSTNWVMLKGVIVENCNSSLLDVVNSQIIIDDSKITNLNCLGSNPGCVATLDASSAVLTNVTIFKIILENEGSLFFVTNMMFLYLRHVYINLISGGQTRSSCIMSKYSQIVWEESFFEATGFSCIYLSYSGLNIVNSTFDNKNNMIQSYNDKFEYGNFLICENCWNVTITNCSFQNNFASNSHYGAAIKASFSASPNLFFINSSSFTNNRASVNGGAIYFYLQNFLILNSTFINNTATNGGAIYFECQIPPSSNIYLKENTFQSNKAHSQGGAIFFFDNLTVLHENVFINNVAGTYANDIGCFPISMRLRIYYRESSTLLPTELNGTYMIYDSQTENIRDAFFDGFPSGHSRPLFLFFNLLDFYNNTVTSINQGFAHLRVLRADYNEKSLSLYAENELLFSKKYDYLNKNISIQGDLDNLNVAGTFYFNNYIIFATPTSVLNLWISDESWQVYYPNLVPDNKSFLKINDSIGLLLTIRLRECVLGEIYMQIVNYCSVCPEGKFSLNTSDLNCNDCPSHVTCPGGSIIIVDAGHWRTPEPGKVRIYECSIKPEACLGGINNTCALGYEGPLCSLCQEVSEGQIKFTKFGLSCTQCMDTYLNGFFLLGISFGLVMTTAIMIRFSLKVNPSNFITTREDETKTPQTALFFKILIDHVQLLGVTENLGFEMPDYFRAMGEAQSSSVFFLEQVLSVDCFFSKFPLPYVTKLDTVMLIRSISVGALPFVAIVLITVYWMLSCLINEKTEKTMSKWTASIVMTLFLINPTILNIMTKYLSCIDLGYESFVINDMNLVCWSFGHLMIILLIVIPSLGLWIFFFPLFCLYKIFRSRKNLKNEETVMKFGFLYNGLHENRFYWGFIKTLQKTLIILIRSSNLSAGIKMVSILLTLILNISWDKFKTCYVHGVLNQNETISNGVALFSLIMSMYFLMDISNTIKLVVFYFVLASNIFFFVFWIRSFVLAKKGVISRVFSKMSKKRIDNLESAKGLTKKNKTTKTSILNKIERGSQRKSEKIIFQLDNTKNHVEHETEFRDFPAALKQEHTHKF